MYLVRWKQIKINPPSTLLTQECEKFVEVMMMVTMVILFTLQYEITGEKD